MIQRLVQEVQEILIDGRRTEAEQIAAGAVERVIGRWPTRLEIETDRVEVGFGRWGDIRQLAMDWARRRHAGEILQYLTGSQGFYGHIYRVGPGVLVPRPETEVLVEQIIHREKQREEQIKEPSSVRRGVEVGVGSGVISIELLWHFAELQMLASDVSAEALHFAQINAQEILGSRWSARLTPVRIQQAHDVLDSIVEKLSGKKVDFIVSNPPYLLPSDEISEDVRMYEPSVALFAPGDDGLFFYRKLAEDCHRVLLPDGRIYLELSSDRADQIQKLFTERGWQSHIVCDLNQKPRVLIAGRQLSEGF